MYLSEVNDFESSMHVGPAPIKLEKKSDEYSCIVFTYDVPHRKTYDTLTLLKAKGFKNVLVYAVPMHYKKTFKPLYEHRPQVIHNIFPSELAKNLGYEYYQGNRYEEFEEKTESVILVCGAGIIPGDIVKSNVIVNAHPGYIPYARGLDALKWAIIEDKPIGVTTHLLGDEVDAGEIISRIEIPVYDNDTFHSVSQRVYENEINMLVDALFHISERHEYIKVGNTILHKRMPSEVEHGLLLKFEEYKQIHACKDN